MSTKQKQESEGRKKLIKVNGRREIFVKGNNIRFILNHPEFPYLYVNKRISIPLTSELELESKINLDRIPAFLIKGKKSDWLHKNQLDSIIEQQNLKESIKRPTKRLEFDTKERRYYWIVFNTLYSEKCLSDEESWK